MAVTATEAALLLGTVSVGLQAWRLLVAVLDRRGPARTTRDPRPRGAATGVGRDLRGRTREAMIWTAIRSSPIRWRGRATHGPAQGGDGRRMGADGEGVRDDRRATCPRRVGGTLLEGQGRLSTESTQVLSDQSVTWASRTEDPGGRTSPEELLAAAHAAC
jgi:hypothetical protein